MTRKVKIASLVLVFLMLLVTCVFAAEPQITIEGENTAKPGETKTVTVKISSEDIEVGVVSGKIEKNANIKSMKASGLNSWSLTYNEETGSFVIHKAEGSKLEEILKIEYILTNEEGTGKITISDICLTTIDYEEEKVSQISKEIVVKVETDGNDPDGTEPDENEPDGNEPDGNEPDGNEPDGNEPDGNEPDGNEPDGNEPDGNEPDGNDPDGTEPDGNEPDGNEPDGNEPDGNEPDGNEPDGNEPDENEPDNTQSNKPIDKAGLEHYVIIMIVLITVIAIISCKKYNQYKNI